MLTDLFYKVVLKDGTSVTGRLGTAAVANESSTPVLTTVLDEAHVREEDFDVVILSRRQATVE